MAKSIIYLDQNFISNMAKARFVGDSELAAKTAQYGRLYDRLKVLVDNDKAICPESIFHQLETEQLTHKNRDLLPGMQTVVLSLSHGLCFRYPWELIRFQVFKAARTFLNLPPQETPDWQDAFTTDPHARVELRRQQKGRRWQIDVSPLKPMQYMRDRKAEKQKFARDSKQTRIEKQKDGVLQLLYGDRIDDFSIGEAADLLEYWRFVGAPEAELPQFLKSAEIRNSPFIDIHCTLQAAFGRDTGRNPLEGDALDTSMMATVAPYCDVVAVSKDMFLFWKEIKLNLKYPVRVFSAQSDQLSDFSVLLTKL